MWRIRQTSCRRPAVKNCHKDQKTWFVKSGQIICHTMRFLGNSAVATALCDHPDLRRNLSTAACRPCDRHFIQNLGESFDIVIDKLFRKRSSHCLFETPWHSCEVSVLSSRLARSPVYSWNPMQPDSPRPQRFLQKWNMLLPSDAIWWHRSGQHIGSANGLLPDGTKP